MLAVLLLIGTISIHLNSNDSTNFTTTKSDDLLAIVQNAHRAAQQAIHTFSCEMAFHSRERPGGGGDYAVKYRRKGETVRFETLVRGHKHECLIDRSEILKISHQKDAKTNANGVAFIQAYEPHNVGLGDVWALALLTFPTKQFGRVSLNELLGQSPSIERIAETVEDGNKIIKLTMKYDIFTTSISFIPEANNLASRLVLDYSPDGVHKFHTDIRVIRFAEPVPGIFFPAEIIGNELSDGVDKAGEANRKFINIMINQPIRDEDLKPMLPDNTLVNDTIRGQYYFVNANGKPITEKKSTNEKKPTQNQVAPEFAASPYTGQTQEEAANHFWLYLGLIATLGIGGFVYWRLRARMA